jgi:hypothetical protein
MLYASYLTQENARYKPGTDGLILTSPDDSILGKGKDPYGFVIVLSSGTEKATIVEDGKDLLKRLAAYKPYLKLEPSGEQHHHGN